MKYADTTEGVRRRHKLPAMTYLNEAELDAMRRLAEAGERSLAAELRLAVRAYLEAQAK